MDGLNFTSQDALNYFGDREIQKGQGYVHRVKLQSVTADAIVANVQGTAAHPYRVVVHFASNRMLSICTCPVATRCKHGAAAALVALKAPKPLAGPEIRSQAKEWLDELQRAVGAAPRTTADDEQSVVVIWRILPEEDWLPPRLVCLKARRQEDGEIGSKLEPWTSFRNILKIKPAFVTADDFETIKLLLFDAQKASDYQLAYFGLQGVYASKALELLGGTGRLFGGQNTAAPLKNGEPRTGSLRWRVLRNGEQVPLLDVDAPGAWCFPTADGILYVDEQGGEIGSVITEQPTNLVGAILRAPALNPLEAKRAKEVLEKSVQSIALPSESPTKMLPKVKAPMVPALLVSSAPVPMHGGSWTLRTSDGMIDFARAEFRYGEIVLEVDDEGELIETEERGTVLLARNKRAEKKALRELAMIELEQLSPAVVRSLGNRVTRLAFGHANPQRWESFMAKTVDDLRSKGWQVEIDPEFRYYHTTVSAWHLDVETSQEGWLDLDLGITVDGERFDLGKLLIDLFDRDPRWLQPGCLSLIGDDEVIYLKQPGSPRVAVEARRVKHIVGTLIDLFSRRSDELRLSSYDAGRVKALVGESSWDTTGLDSVLGLAGARLTGEGPTRVEAPRGLMAQLRHYQLDGLSWLQFLREHDLGGILADDMGLGKTLQALAHILTEKEAGRLDSPALVVMPTSLINTWQDEASRFTPELRVLTLHGPDRKASFGAIGEHDIVLTTYPLIWRDIAALKDQSFHLLVLDEAQNVKNPAAKASIAIRQLKTRHRLCLSGTPIENHLSELWSQFDILLPGFLGDRNFFREIWSTPVEVHHDLERLQVLAQRVRPFILRRTKSEVAAELPAKTVVVQAVEMERAQHDLYESVRATMDKRIRDEIVSRGIERSHIVILDALLKLRQVCCDPRLLKSTTAKRVASSAKLAALMEMIPELLEDGRRILLFSQFTQMLDIIAAELTKAKLDFVTLRGDTTDRKTPVDRFQNGEVPLFLISLKAGGVGLNLTAADTVIHYDPWWNPAAEDQATDRAHRIGQTKPVFVYKLIVAGSIEEKILALQERKAQLAAGVLDEAQAGSVKFGQDDLASLLSPLPLKSR
ncbi:SNF2-related protein [Ferrimicrobium sp.]|uniref:DEAD/DEAH box helicase n=1 Tax=Ferrimicrobium sp. TaxID=2926050 RepID=UPI002617D2E5|nr:SNF2-related protein [Ferrimicrobium sp.]